MCLCVVGVSLGRVLNPVFFTRTLKLGMCKERLLSPSGFHGVAGDGSQLRFTRARTAACSVK